MMKISIIPKVARQGRLIGSQTSLLLRLNDECARPLHGVHSRRCYHQTDHTPTTTEKDLHTSLFKNPIVQRLWKERQKAKKQDPPSDIENKGSKPSSSRVEVPYPFSTDALLSATYKNPWGQIRMGKMLEDLDALAGNIAFFHTHNAHTAGDDFPIIVTASVDRIRLRRQPAVDKDQKLTGQVSWTGRSSMEIKMTCIEDNDPEEWLEALVTYVTLDPHTKRPIAVPTIQPETPEEQIEFENGTKRANFKKEMRKHQQSHKLVSGEPDDVGSQVEELAHKLLDEASPLLNLPSLADPHDILMNQTGMQTAEIAQPQTQNLHNRIFGGFLMRRAAELAFATTYVFAGARPVFLEVDQVSFTKPVDVGDLLQFQSRVLYTDKGGKSDSVAGNVHGQDLSLVHVEVETIVTVPEEAKSQVSNQFYFTFAVAREESKDSDKPIYPIRRILPSTIEEGRRMARRMIADKEQRRID